jgi:hypothetical protein
MRLVELLSTPFASTAGSSQAGAANSPLPWGSLADELLLLVVCNLQDKRDLAAAHLVSRSWRRAVLTTVQALEFRHALPDTEQLRQVSRPSCKDASLVGLMQGLAQELLVHHFIHVFDWLSFQTQTCRPSLP